MYCKSFYIFVNLYIYIFVYLVYLIDLVYLYIFLYICKFVYSKAITCFGFHDRVLRIFDATHIDKGQLSRYLRNIH